MGGSALKNIVTRRYLREEYFTAAENILTILKSELGIECDLIKSYSSKESFGDIDIIYTGAEALSEDKFRKLFSPDELVTNSNVTSLNYEQIQVDFIYVSDNIYDYASSYYAFNDLGNLIGKCAHQFGLKHGHAGLYLPLYDGTNKFASLLLTTDYSVALEFLGFDSIRFNEGFDSLPEIFDYVESSEFFNPEIYSLDKLNSVDRIRDKKRTTYQQFLSYCSNLSTEYPEQNRTNIENLEYIFSSFPFAYAEYKDMMRDRALNMIAKQKFNGELVSSITGFVGKDLGKFMKHIRNDFSFTPENIMYATDFEIHEKIIKEYKGSL
jgi:hypothetical protein